MERRQHCTSAHLRLEPMGHPVGLQMVLVELEHFLVDLLIPFVTMTMLVLVSRLPGVTVQENEPVPWISPRLQSLMLCNGAVCW